MENLEHISKQLISFPIFCQLTPKVIYNVLRCLECYVRTYDKSELIYDYEDNIQYAGLILNGSVDIIMHNIHGNELGIQRQKIGSMFATAFACVPNSSCNIQVVSKEKSNILFLKLSNLFLPKALSCPNASALTTLLLQETARNNIFQTTKIQLISQKHIREKIILYLCHMKKEKNCITLPFNRQDFANYLGVDRSALSRELYKMKEEKLIDISKNKIFILSNFSHFS